MRLLLSIGFLALVLTTISAQTTELKIGDTAPDFTLRASDGKTYTLSQFRGKQAVVLAWFPKSFTQACTIECRSLVKNGALIEKYDVAYFMISLDPIETDTGLAEFARANHANFPMLADPTKIAADAYGVLRDYEQGRMLPSRWTFYIDKAGRIGKIDKAVNPATAAEDIAATLAELKIATK